MPSSFDTHIYLEAAKRGSLILADTPQKSSNEDSGSTRDNQKKSSKNCKGAIQTPPSRPSTPNNMPQSNINININNDSTTPINININIISKASPTVSDSRPASPNGSQVNIGITQYPLTLSRIFN
jgi:hypothetical protein